MITIAYNLGIVHVMSVNPKYVLDVVPADYVVNNLIAAAWNVGTSWKNSKFIEIYNCTICLQNPITWEEYNKLANKHDVTFPFRTKIWHRFVILTVNKTIASLFFYLKLPLAYTTDIYNSITGKPRSAVKMYKKIHYLLCLLNFFTETQWTFNDKNNQQLWNKLEEKDKKLFNFDLRTIDWDTMTLNTATGIRQYIFEEPLEALSQAIRKRQQLEIVHYLTIVMLLLFLIYLFLLIFQFFKGIM